MSETFAVIVSGADLEGEVHARGTAVEELRSVELGRRGDAVHFGQERRLLVVDVRTLGRAQRAVGRLDGELSDARQNTGDLVHRAFRRLQQRDAVVAVALCLRHRLDLRLQA